MGQIFKIKLKSASGLPLVSPNDYEARRTIFQHGINGLATLYTFSNFSDLQSRDANPLLTPYDIEEVRPVSDVVTPPPPPYVLEETPEYVPESVDSDAYDAPHKQTEADSVHSPLPAMTEQFLSNSQLGSMTISNSNGGLLIDVIKTNLKGFGIVFHCYDPSRHEMYQIQSSGDLIGVVSRQFPDIANNATVNIKLRTKSEIMLHEAFNYNDCLIRPTFHTPYRSKLEFWGAGVAISVLLAPLAINAFLFLAVIAGIGALIQQIKAWHAQYHDNQAAADDHSNAARQLGKIALLWLIAAPFAPIISIVSFVCRARMTLKEKQQETAVSTLAKRGVPVSSGVDDVPTSEVGGNTLHARSIRDLGVFSSARQQSRDVNDVFDYSHNHPNLAATV